MAFSVRLRARNEKTGETLWYEDPADWWNSDELRDDPRFRKQENNPSYLDHVAVLTADTALVLNQHYAKDPLPWMKPRAEALTEKLRALVTIGGVVDVVVYEWESGM